MDTTRYDNIFHHIKMLNMFAVEYFYFHLVAKFSIWKYKKCIETEVSIWGNTVSTIENAF